MDVYGALILHGNEIRGARFENLATAGAPAHSPGVFYFDTDLGRGRLSDGGAWLDFGGVVDGSIVNAKIADNAVTQAKMADNSVGTAEIIDANVTLAKLAANSVDSSKIVDGSIVNADINAGAAIAKSKLAALDIVNADVNAAAAIARSKLDFGAGLVNTDIAAGAAIAKTKLAALAIVNADVAAGAAIDQSKLNLSITDAQVNAAAAIARSKLDFGTGLVNADLAAAAAIAYSKLNLTGAIVNADIAAAAGIVYSKLDATTVQTAIRTNRLDQFVAPTANVSMGSQKIVNLADPTAAQDAATKNYVDLMRQGIRLKDAVRVASTGAINLAAPGANIDGVAMVANDRVLVKNQADHSTDGIYVWNGAAVAMTRAADADTAAELQDGATTFVQEGTANNATTWAQTTPLASLATAQNWAQQGAATNYLGGAGLVLNGTTFDIVAGDATIVVNADNIVAGVMQTANLADGSVTSGKIANGTIVNEDIAAGAAIDVAKVNGAIRKTTHLIGNGALTSFVVNHARAGAVQAEVYLAGTGEKVYPNIFRTDANNVTVTFSGYVPGNNEFEVVIQG